MKSFVFITGACGGLGKAFAVECASRGWDLFITDLYEEQLQSLASGISTAYGINVIYHPCDLTDAESRSSLINIIRDRKIKFLSLINVAGIDFEGYFAERTISEIQKLIRLNIESTVEITRSILELRDPLKSFRVIMVSSLAAFYPMPVKALYAASKRFLLDFSLALREEIRDMGGTVTVLCPAGMPTTEITIRAIDAQGFIGRATTTNVGFVAAKTIDSALKGRRVYVPGTLNKIIRLLGSLVPPALVSHLVGQRWSAAHKKSHSSPEEAKHSGLQYMAERT